MPLATLSDGRRMAAASPYRAQDLTEGAGRIFARLPQLTVCPTQLIKTTVTLTVAVVSRRVARRHHGTNLT